MVWIKTLKDDYVNADNIISITSDQISNAIVAVVGYKEARLQHIIYQHKVLDDVLQGKPPRSDTELIEKIIEYIEIAAQGNVIHILDFTELLADF